MNYLTSKLAYGDLYRTDFRDGHVIWKTIPWDRYRRYRDARDLLGSKLDIDLEASVYAEAVIHSSFDVDPIEDLSEEDYALFLAEQRQEQPAGIITTVAKLILQFSGCTNSERIMQHLDQSRVAIRNIEDQIVACLCKAFPAYKPEDVEKMSWPNIMKRLAQAELLLANQYFSVPFALVNPEEAENSANKFDLEKEMKLDREHGLVGPGEGPDYREEEIAQLRREKAKLREQYLRQKGF